MVRRRVAFLGTFIKVRSLLITGGTGSFGQAFVAEILGRFPRMERLVVFRRDELKQLEMAQKFPVDRYSGIRFFLGDVRDPHGVSRAMEGCGEALHLAILSGTP